MGRFQKSGIARFYRPWDDWRLWDDFKIKILRKNDQTSFYSALYFNRMDGTYTFAIRGTQEAKDWITNFGQPLGAPGQYVDAQRAGTELGQTFPGKICGVGHSFGGRSRYRRGSEWKLSGLQFQPGLSWPLNRRSASDNVRFSNY